MGLFNKKKKETFEPGDIAFATYVPSGRKPDVEIHIAGFERGPGLESMEKFDGRGSYISATLSGAVRSWVERLKKDSYADAMAAASMIMHRIIEAMGEDDAEHAWDAALHVTKEMSAVKTMAFEIKPEDGKKLVELLEQAKANGENELPPEAMELLEELLSGQED